MLLPGSPAWAQLANASARSLGLAGNDTATVRGFGAISVNPAGLAMPDSDFSLTIAPVRASVGVVPITLADVKEFENEEMDPATKKRWMDNVDDAEGQRIAAGVDLSELALTFGNFGFQLSSVAAVSGHLPPDVVEAALFGNAGRTGKAKTLVLDEGSVTGYAGTSAGVSVAFPIFLLEEHVDHLAVGVTATYTMGHAMAVGEVSGEVRHDVPIGTSQESGDSQDRKSIDVSGTLVHTQTDEDDWTHYVHGGGGLGLDLGVMVAWDRWSVGASVRNVFNTFAWDESKLVYRPITASVKPGSTELEYEERPYDAAAPARTKELVEDLTFRPSLRVGGAYDALDELTVSGDFHYRFGDGIALDPQYHVGIGTEYRGLEVVHLRGGVALVDAGFQYGGGLSVILGVVNLSAAVGGLFDGQLLAQFVLSFGNR